MTAGVPGFDRRIAPFRAELLAYCYRMVGSAHDAEDLVQDVYLRAWRAREQYDPARSSLRTWLYRVATNVCLTALESRARRPLPSGLVPASDPAAPLVHGGNRTWLQPLPDALLDLDDPERTVVDRSSLRLVLAGALQRLSERERAAVVLRGLLDFSAAETAQALGTTTASVTSALQRGRARLRVLGVDGINGDAREPSSAEQRAWVDRYMAAFVHADVDGLTQLLTHDVVMEMPPMVNWFTGPEAYGRFMEWVFTVGGSDWDLRAVAANGQPGFASYRRAGGVYELHTLQLFTVTASGISRNSVFQDPVVFSSFGLPSRFDVRRP